MWTQTTLRAGFKPAVLAIVSSVAAAAALTPAAPPDPLTPPANGPRRADPSVAALVGATVHVSPSETLECATVVLRHGRIESVVAAPGPRGDGVPVPPAPPPEATAWDCTGLHVYAAFIEPAAEVDAPMPDRSKAGVHWNIKVTPQRRALEGPGLDAATAKSLRSLGFGAAAIAPRGGVFRGQAAVVSLAEPESEASASRPPVYADTVYHALAFETGRDSYGGEGGGDNTRWDGYPNSQMGAIALIRQTLIDAAWSARPGAGSGALAPLSIHAAAPLCFSTEDELEVLRAAKIAAEFKRPLVIIGSGTEFRRLEAIAALKAPVILPLNLPRRPSIAGIGDAEAVSLGELMTWEQAPTNARRLMAAGVPVAFSAARMRERGQFRDHLRAAIRHGLAEEAALASLTTVPARLLGVGDQLGTVERGKRASLIVTDGPIFAKKSKLRDVWIDGRRHEITPAPAGLEGEYEIALDPPPRIPGRITMVVDKENAVTIKKLPDAPAEAARPQPDAPRDGAQAPPADAPHAPADQPPRKVREQTSRAKNVVATPLGLSLVFDHEPFGTAGMFTLSGQVEPRSIPRVITGDGRRADGAPFRWTATRIGDGRPGGGWAGRYRFASENDQAIPEGQAAPEIIIADDLAVSIKSDRDAKPVTAEDAKIDENALSLTIDGAAIGADEGAAAITAERGGTVLKGSIKLADGRERRFAAIRVNPDEDDEPRPDVPAGLPGHPFGAYALESLPPQESVALVNATVWTCGPAGVIQDGAVVIAEGKLAYVGPAASLPRLAGTVAIIDCTGKHIAPGIIDCHSHTGISRGVNESGQAVTAEVRIGDVTDPDSINWYRQLAGGVTAVNSLHGSANPIGGQNQVNKIRWGCAHPDDMHFEGAIPGIKFALGENVKWGNSSSDRGSWRYPQTRMGVETLIRDRFIAAREYAAARQSGASAAGATPTHRDLELEALAEILAGKRLVHCHSYRQDEILMLGRMAQEFGFRIGTYQHILEGYKVAEIVRESGGGSGFSDWWAYKVEVQDAIPEGFPIMHEQGVVVSYNSDSDELARRLNVEAGKGVKYSDGRLSAEEALKFVTINPAKQLQIDGRVGSLEAGKDADLAIWSGVPVSSLVRCEATYVDGRRLYSLEDDRKLRERDASERHRLIQKVLADTKARPGGSSDGPGAGPPAGRRPGGRRPPQDEADSRDGFAASRAGLLSRMLDDAADIRRAWFLDMVRRGINPADVRGGECGCEEW